MIQDLQLKGCGEEEGVDTVDTIQYYNNLRQTDGNGCWVVRGPPCIVIMMADDTSPPLLPPTTQPLELNLSFIASDSLGEPSLSEECLANCTEQLEDEAPYYYQWVNSPLNY